MRYSSGVQTAAVATMHDMRDKLKLSDTLIVFGVPAGRRRTAAPRRAAC
jgi:hypothetical protein